ncbi:MULTISPECIES: Txe/YoeB family addiction module toxin [Chryseobacterium]|uniref:Putative mRNA interferase YoeB n=2 Tax=Chryseobacterium TaxID=59732 RepID=A0A6N4X9H0_9FLAO|nr:MULTISPECIES: Txe/YoeB family addiction module toxin [Chryseobacterium]CAA7197435.1 Toxin RelK [Chryseobacterium potabilaquae]CAA7392186.1 Toxin RelK [Chryseobacterium fistulae]
MSLYSLEFTEDSLEQISDFKKSDKQSFNKVSKLLEELMEHPYTGTGKPEQLKGDYSGYWSRRINKKDRLIYRIDEKSIIVFVLSVKGHYND